MANILQLDDHMLLSIFELCMEREIEALHSCCVRFRNIIELFILRKQCLDLLLTGTRNPTSEIRRRYKHNLSCFMSKHKYFPYFSDHVVICPTCDA